MDYRDKVWGMDREAGWEPLLPSSGLSGIDAKGPWLRQDDSVKCEAGAEGAHLIFGGHDWRDYELRSRVVAESGGNVQIVFRMSEEGKRGYMLDLLLGWQAIAISRFDHTTPARGVEKLSVVNHEFRHGRAYDVELAARGFSLTSYVDGVLANQVTAFEHEKGRFALVVWNARTTFERPMYRRLA